jgi:hypothetical protein
VRAADTARSYPVLIRFLKLEVVERKEMFARGGRREFFRGGGGEGAYQLPLPDSWWYIYDRALGVE